MSKDFAKAAREHAGSSKASEETQRAMNTIGLVLDEHFNGELTGKDRKVCFVLLVSSFGDIDGGRVNYISNGDRRDTIAMMKEYIARAEAQSK